MAAPAGVAPTGKINNRRPIGCLNAGLNLFERQNKVYRCRHDLARKIGNVALVELDTFRRSVIDDVVVDECWALGKDYWRGSLNMRIVHVARRRWRR